MTACPDDFFGVRRIETPPGQNYQKINLLLNIWFRYGLDKRSAYSTSDYF
jgi:hypothetical protein